MMCYFKLQFKRLLLFFPFVLIVTMVMFFGLSLVFNGFIKLNNENADNKIFKVGITGETNNEYFQLGKIALETLDSSRFSIAFVELEEEQARDNLEKGEISAYVIIPEEFIESAMRGEIKSIKYVTTSGSVGMISFFKDEITKIVEELLHESQKGVFGLENAMVENGYGDVSNKYINKLNIEYIDYIVNRSNMYKVSEIGVSNGLSLPEYLLCGIAVFFLLIITLPYAALYVKKDLTLNKIISANGYSAFKQILSEFFSFFIILLLTVGIVLTVFSVITRNLISLNNIGTFSFLDIIYLLLYLTPVIMMSSIFNILLFEMTENIVSGVLLQFFLTLSLCYVSGCLYPLYAFPEAVQKIAIFLPTGLSREYLSDFLVGEDPFIKVIGIIAYCAVFYVFAVLIRKIKIDKRLSYKQ